MSRKRDRATRTAHVESGRKGRRASVSQGFPAGVWQAGLAGLWLLTVALYQSALELDFLRSKTYPLLAGATLAIGGLGVAAWRGRVSLPRTLLDLFILGWILALAMSAVAAPHPVLAVPAFAVSAAPFLGFYLAVRAARAGAGAWLQGAIVAAGCVVAVIALMQAADIPVLEARSASLDEVALEGRTDLYRTFSTLGHKNLVASFCLVAAGAAAGLGRGARRQGARAAGWLGLGVLLAGLAVSWSRTGWAVGFLLFVIGVLAWGVLPRLLARGWAPGRLVITGGVALLLIAGSGVVVGVARPALTREVVRTLSLDDPWNAFNNRGMHWIIAARMVRDHPLLGVGAGHFGQAYTDHLIEVLAGINDPYRGGNQANQAHCDPLQVAAEEGLVGLLAYLALWVALAMLAVRAMTRLEPPERDRCLGLLMGIAAFHLAGLMDFPGASPPHVLAVWMMAGLVLGEDPETRERWVTWVAPGAYRLPCLAAAALVVLMGLWRVGGLREGDRALVAGRRAYQSGQIKAARPLLDKAIALDGGLAQAWFWRGRVAHREGAREEARRYLERSRALWAFYPVDLALGFLALDENAPARAVEPLTRYITVRPLAPPRDYQLLCLALKRAGRKEAAHLLEMADTAKRLEMGRMVEEEGKLDEAFNWYMSVESDAGYLAAIRVAVREGRPARGTAVLSRIQNPEIRSQAAQTLTP